MSATANRIVKNTGFLYARMGITMFISLYSTRLILNALGATDFGIFGIVGGAIAMLGFLNGSMASATQRFMSYSLGVADLEYEKSVFNNSVILHLLIAFFVFAVLEIVAYPLFHGLLSIPSDRMGAAQFVYQFMVVSSFFTVVAVPYDAAINAHENMFYYAVIGLVESLIKLAIAFYVVITLKDKLIIYGLFTSMLTIMMLLAKYLYCRKKYEECSIQLCCYYNKSTMKEMMGFAGWSFVDISGSMIGNNGGDIVLNHYFGPSVNAAGNIGAQLRGQMMAFSNSLIKALNPVIIKKEGEGNRKGMMAFVFSGSKMTYLLFAMMALPFIVDTPFILEMWLKQVPEWTVCFSRLQMIAGLGYQLTVPLGTALAASGLIKNFSIFSGIAHVAPLPLCIALYSIGLDPYWTYLIFLIDVVLIVEGYRIYQCHLHCGLDIMKLFRKVIIPCALCTLLSFLAGEFIVFLYEPSFIRLVLIVLITNFVLFFSSFCILLNEKEQDYLKIMIIKLFRKVNC